MYGIFVRVAGYTVAHDVAHLIKPSNWLACCLHLWHLVLFHSAQCAWQLSVLFNT
jgi:hypothetical protein